MDQNQPNLTTQFSDSFSFPFCPKNNNYTANLEEWASQKPIEIFLSQTIANSKLHPRDFDGHNQSPIIIAMPMGILHAILLHQYDLAAPHIWQLNISEIWPFLSLGNMSLRTLPICRK
jgi:hypothetical protein